MVQANRKSEKAQQSEETEETRNPFAVEPEADQGESEVKSGDKSEDKSDLKKDENGAERSVDLNGNPVVSFNELDEFVDNIPGIAAPPAKK